MMNDEMSFALYVYLIKKTEVYKVIFKGTRMVVRLVP